MNSGLDVAIIYLKDALKRTVETMKVKFDVFGEELSGIKTDLILLKNDIPINGESRMKLLEEKMDNLEKRMTDMENSRKREVEIYSSRMEKLEKGIEHLKEANRVMGNRLESLEKNGGKND